MAERILSSSWSIIAQKIEWALPAHLTVLCYHRIAEAVQPSFFGYWPNASASSIQFDAQLAYLAKRYNFITLNDLQRFLQDKQPLPIRPLLITFDDGYRDNLTVAAPILEQFGVSAVFFIATSFVGGAKAFPSDYAAHAILSSARTEDVNLPLLGLVNLAGNRHQLVRQIVGHIKHLTETEIVEVFAKLALELDVPYWGQAPAGLHLTAQDIKALQSRGHVIGAHTVTHGNIGDMPLAEAAEEFAQSRLALVGITEQQVTAFAYPFGGAVDHTLEAEAEIARQGFTLAFVAKGGFSFLSEIQRRPFAIRRIMIGAKDVGPRFAAKVTLGARLRGR